MPMPTPETAETEADFVDRCMENEVMVEDYPTEKQRAAVCHSQYGNEYDAVETAKLSVFCLGSQPGRVDREGGTIEGISILSVGEARGHGMMISQKTLEAAIVLLIGKSLPAYLSHSGAQGDRLLTEAGFFSGFYRDRDQIRARKFTALDTFKKYDREKYDRLFEIAEKAPATFGVSIVFEGQLFWEMRDGSEVSIEVGLDAPENSRFEIPTVRPLTITSADFVDTPAANGALFSRKVDTHPISEDMNAEIETLEQPTTTTELGDPPNESASAHHVSDEEPAPAPAPAPAPEPEPEAKAKPKRKKKKLAKKKKVLAQDEEDEEDEREGEEDEIAKEEQGDDPDSEADPDEEERDEDEEELEKPDDEYQEKMRAAVEETYTHLENAVQRLREIMDMTGVPNTREEESGEESAAMGELEKLKARVDELTKLHAGTPPIKEISVEFTTPTDAKKHLISLHLEAHPKDSRSTAVLAVAKTNPELFKNN